MLRRGTAALRVLTVTPNPAIDKTYWLERVRPGETLRVKRVTARAGGKGLNVLRVLTALGVPAEATGMIGGHAGAWIRTALEVEGLANDFLQIEGESRATVTLVETDGRVTELLEPGPLVRAREADAFLRHLERLAERVTFVTMSGSLPPGLDPSHYADMVRMVQASGARACVDTSGAALSAAVPARPFLVKINHHELRQWLQTQREPMSDPAVEPVSRWVIDGARSLVEAGAEVAVVTCGDQGSFLSTRTDVWYARPLVLVPKHEDGINPVGSGDAFFAGLLAGWHRFGDWLGALRVATAAGASNAEHPVAGTVDPSDVWRRSAEVVVNHVVHL
ncbi:1-phosphofructokinase family hexose kinase [Alicyclobacillus sp.]|uniref:1-phosphofructokinase family hexose kinase n=1 Tax=Alicyclobacillus sp. TaxID=61169 RepID=UPI0025BFD079|nr:1-phosphofructokinase family hexose kinase [Alicyclobacillus sp.]MCL6516661.1 1-phosphofructokinase family hexose kinase [Alicyclobacillus sp.]